MPNPTPEALVACPFCGGDAAVNTTRTTDPEFIRLNKRDTGYGVNCVVCGANNKGSSIGYRTRELAVSAWNKRAALASREPAVQPEATPGAVDDDACNRLIGALDEYARSRDAYEYGLPIHHDDAMPAMREVIRKALIDSAGAEGEG